jgi:putative ABC transport system ATP-binding protein
MLTVDSLVKRYTDGDGKLIKAVDGVTLTIAPGEFVALYGPSGSGKTTLLDLIAGFQTPDAGAVRLNGRDIAQFSGREHAHYLLRKLGIVGQPEELMPGATVRENARLKLLRTNARRADRLIEPLLLRLGLCDRMNHPTNKLSMGERQRVLIAQALSLNPELVLADEPTGHLDTIRSREVLGLLRDLCHQGKAAVLLATHDPQAVAFADQTYELRDGRLQPFNADEIFQYAAGRMNVGAA